MRVVRRLLLFLVVLPFTLMALAARFPAFDPVTLSLPHPVRAAVATLAVHESPGVEAAPVFRALALDPENAAAWNKRCTAFLGVDAGERLSDCRRAVELHPTTASLRALGSALEEQGDVCPAAAAYGRALETPDASGQRPLILREQARAALDCGDTAASLDALHRAETLDLREAGTADPLVPALRDALSSDHAYLSIVYRRLHQPDQANLECVAANPGYSSCTCERSAAGFSCTPGGPVLTGPVLDASTTPPQP